MWHRPDPVHTAAYQQTSYSAADIHSSCQLISSLPQMVTDVPPAHQLQVNWPSQLQQQFFTRSDPYRIMPSVTGFYSSSLSAQTPLQPSYPTPVSVYQQMPGSSPLQPSYPASVLVYQPMPALPKLANESEHELKDPKMALVNSSIPILSLLNIINIGC